MNIASALDLAAIGYHRKRRELAGVHIDPDDALRHAIAVNNIPVYSKDSVGEAKRNIREDQHRREYAKFTDFELWLSQYQVVLMLAVICLTAILITAAVMAFHLRGLWLFGCIMLGGAIGILIEIPIFRIKHPDLAEWRPASLQEYGERFVIPDLILTRAVSIAKIAPAAEFSVEYFGTDPILVVSSCISINALRLYIGHWGETMPDSLG